MNSQKGIRILMIGIVIVSILIFNRLRENQTVISTTEETIVPVMQYVRYDFEAHQAPAYFSLNSWQDIWRNVTQLPRQMWHLVFNPTQEQMQFFIRDGFSFVAPRISQSSDVTLLTWQPVEPFVRTEQLIHTEEIIYEDIPIATYINSDEPLVYFFNAHPHEMIGGTFADLNVGEMNIREISHLFANIFQDFGIPSLVENQDVRDVIRSNNWSFVDSYRAARLFLEERIHQYPSLQFFFDIHREGIAHDLARIDINGRPYARILFVIGADNPVGYSENYQIARTLHQMLEEARPGISRGISVQGGPFNNGIYNQDVAPTLQVFEIGTVETTIEEAINTVEIFAEVLATFILNKVD